MNESNYKVTDSVNDLQDEMSQNTSTINDLTRWVKQKHGYGIRYERISQKQISHRCN